jgi:hypothetical protein
MTKLEHGLLTFIALLALITFIESDAPAHIIDRWVGLIQGVLQ